MGFGPAVAAMTRSRPSTRPPRAARREPAPAVGTRRRPGSGVRPDRPRPPSRPARHVPRQGTDRRMAEGGRGRGRPVRPDRGGNSPGRGGQPRAAERGAARDGARRRSPLPARSAAMPRTAATGSPVLIRYADDLVALCHTRHEAQQVKARLAAWLAPRGLVFNEDKTRIVTLDEGFDFLGFNVRRYRGKLLIKPSKAAVRRIRERLRTELRSLRGTNAQAVHHPAQPHHPGLVGLLPDGGVQRDRSPRWITTCGSSPTSGPSIATRTSRPGGSSAGTSACSASPGTTGGCSATAKAAPTCRKFAWTKIVRHQMVRGTSSPDDPALTELLGRPAAQGNTPADRTRPACGSWRPSTAAARSAGNLLLRRRPPAAKPARVGTVADGHPQGDDPQRHRPAGGRHAGRGYTPSPARSLPPAAHAGAARAQHFCPPASPRGLLEPDAVETSHVRF